MLWGSFSLYAAPVVAAGTSAGGLEGTRGGDLGKISSVPVPRSARPCQAGLAEPGKETEMGVLGQLGWEKARGAGCPGEGWRLGVKIFFGPSPRSGAD